MATKSTATAHSSSEGMRKQPQQERALRTVNTIFEATARILEQEGEAALNTNKIARKAGFSVGTLYQYFPTKEAILEALAERERRRMLADLQVDLDRAVREGIHPKVLLRERIRALNRAFGPGKLLNRPLMRLLWTLDHHDSIAQVQRESAERMAIAMAQLKHPELREGNPAMLFVATRAVIGAIRSASLEDSPLLGSVEFEEELTRMVWGLIAA